MKEPLKGYIMDYSSKIDSLEEKALIEVAIGLCQGNDFKEAVLCLEKPTYGDFLSASYVSDEKKVEQWDRAVDEQCQRLTEGLHNPLKHRVQGWISRMALEYLSYGRRQEALFGLSRCFLMDFLTREDWTEAGRLDEKKLAERLVKDERLTALQRYRIACVYCLHVDSQDCMIPPLWKQLTQEERQSISGNDDPNLSQERNPLVLLWSYYMAGGREEKVTRRKSYLWQYAVQQAVYYGNRVTLIPCWKWMKEPVRQSMVMDMALQSLRQWVSAKNRHWREKLVSNKSTGVEYAEYFNLPSYYSNLMCFFLSEMNEEQQLIFFKKAFQDKYCSSVLECFLDWPHQDYFLSTVRKLWGILPKDKYGQYLLTLANKYSGDYDSQIRPALLYKKEDCYYDYRKLLSKLWEETPEDYKRKALFYEVKVLLTRLVNKYPFINLDEDLFKEFFSDATSEEKKGIVFGIGKNICSKLIKKESWFLVHWFLNECLSEDEITSFKKQFIQSDYGHELCFDSLTGNREKLLKDLIDWSFELDKENTEFKNKLIYGKQYLDICKSLVCKEKYSEVERMLSFCLSTEEQKRKFRENLPKATSVFESLIEDRKWDSLDNVLTYCFDSEKKKIDIKKDIFSCKGIDIHCDIVFREQWEDAERFYQWFQLSKDEIKQFKKDTIFLDLSIENIHELLYDQIINNDGFSEGIEPYLRWCLTDETMALEFKKHFENVYLTGALGEEEQKIKDYFNSSIDKLASDLRKIGNNKRSREGLEEEHVVSLKRVKLSDQAYSSVQAIGEKRANDVIEEASSPPKKRVAK